MLLSSNTPICGFVFLISGLGVAVILCFEFRQVLVIYLSEIYIVIFVLCCKWLSLESGAKLVIWGLFWAHGPVEPCTLVLLPPRGLGDLADVLEMTVQPLLPLLPELLLVLLQWG